MIWKAKLEQQQKSLKISAETSGIKFELDQTFARLPYNVSVVLKTLGCVETV